MSEVDDWAPVKQSAPAQDADDWTPVRAPAPADPYNPDVSDQAPQAFMDRVGLGGAIARITSAAVKEGAEGAGQGAPTGFEDETLARLIELGVFHDPLKSTSGPLRIAQGANEMLMMPAAQLWQTITRATSAGIHGAGGAYGQLVSELGGSQGDANRARRDIIGAGEWAMIEGGMGRFSRTSIGRDMQAADAARGPTGRVLDQEVGGLPKPEDFTNAAKVLSEKPEVAPVVEANLKQMWQEDGIHPAEAVHDAQADAFIKHDITTPSITAYHGTDAAFETPDIAYGGRLAGTEANTLFYTPDKEMAGRFGSRVLHNQIDMSKSDVFDAEKLIQDPAFMKEVEQQYATEAERSGTKVSLEDTMDTVLKRMYGVNEDIRPLAEIEQDIAREKAKGEPLSRFYQQLSDKIDQLRGRSPRAPGPVLHDLGVTGAIIDRARKQGIDVAVVKNLSEGGGSAPDQIIVLNNKAIKPVSVGGYPMPREDFEALSATGNVPVDAPPAATPPVKSKYTQGDLLEAQLKYQEAKWRTEQVESNPFHERIAAEAKAKLDEIESGLKPQPVGAAVTPPEDMPPLVSPRVQPASSPGQLTAAVKGAASTLLDIGRDAQMLVAPMARGTRDSMAMAKDFANSLRRNRWDWARIDEDIKKRFDPEARARMWNAADEESVSLQLKEPAHMREHQGLTTLEPEEKALVDDLQARAQNAWLRAQDVGIVQEGAEGLPSYTPRMVMNVGTAFADDRALPLNSIGNNLKVRTAQMLRRKHMTVEETEAAAKDYVGMQAALKGKSAEEIQDLIDKVAVARDIRALPLATSKLEDAIAGRTLINNIKDYGKQTGTETVVEGAIPAGETKFFTLDHPAFRSWRPKLEEGKAVKDAEGNVIFEQVPLYVHGDFEGPLRAVLTQKSGPLYGAAMAVKGKTMSLIMNSPMIHNAVEWGRAVPALPGKVATFKVYFEGNRAKKDIAVMHEAIDAGLVPIGHRFFNQDITSMMETPDLTPGRSWTAKVLGFVPGLFDEGAGTAVKAAIDKAGDFWHNTLLWDRVADLQMGLYTNFRADAMAKGIDQQTASRMAAHWANRYAGALPKEAMSDAATKVSNMLLFSRSFTMGNLGVLKDVFTGLPKDVIAQIERDAGFGRGSIEAADAEAPAQAVAYAKSMARRKAMSVVALDMALMYVGNSILQNVMNVMTTDSTLDKEMHGYAVRFQNKLQAMKEHPLELVQPLKLMEDLSATSENEPGRKDRVKVGSAADGTSIYARNPVGKIGDEFLGYMTGPLDMMRKKMGTIARPAWQVMNNDAGFGRKVYDPDADTPAKYLANLGRIVAHIAGSQLPEGQIRAVSDLVKGDGDKKVNMMQAFGPFAGVTFSKGAPGGPAVGEMYAARSQHEFKVNQALPDIRKQILRGDIAGAQEQMQGLGIPAGLQRFYVRSTLNPATRMSPRAVQDFYRYATPEQKDRFLRARQAAP